MRVITIILVLFFGLLQYRLWFGKNSVPDYLALENEVARQQLDNDKLKQRNKILYADTDDLKSGVEAIEERARNELGMIKEGETFFRIVYPTKDINRHRQSSTANNNLKDSR
ncbi:MAG: cell division protein FtsB [Alteromonadaceae bacterium]|jgi:cell division protein FtsB